MSEKERLVEELPQSDTKSTGRQSSPTEHVKDQAHHTASTSSLEDIGDIEATVPGTDVSAIKETGEHYASEAANYAHAAYNHVEEHAPTPDDVLPDEQAQQARNGFASAQSRISSASSRIKSFLAKTIDSYGLHAVLLSLSVATLCTLSLTGLFALPSPILITKSSSIEGLGIQQAIWLAITIVAALTTRKAPSIAMVESLVLTAWYLMWAVFTKKGWWALAYLSVSIFFSLLSLAFYHKRQQSLQPRDENV